MSSYLNNYLSNQQGGTGNPYATVQTTGTTNEQVNTGLFGTVDMQRNVGPDDVFANITRAQALDLENRFYPLDDLNQATVMDPERRAELHGQAMGIVDSAVDNSFARADERMQTLRSRSNTQLRADEQESLDRQSALSKTATKVQSRNATRSYLRERDNEILMGTQQ